MFDNKSCLEDRPPVVILVNGENDKFVSNNFSNVILERFHFCITVYVL